MAGTPFGQSERTHPEQPETLAETLFYLSDPAKRKELEEYRIEFEAVNGPTNLTRRYTSTWPVEQQEWLIKNHVERYFDGLPLFAKAYLRGKMQMAAQDGKLDDMPDALLRLYVSGGMNLERKARGR